MSRAGEIEVRNLTQAFRGHHRPICDNLSFTVPARSRLSVIGPNGAGKTTLLNILSGIAIPDKGSVLIWEEDAPAHPSESLNLVGYVSAAAKFAPQLTLGEIIEIAKHLACAWDDDRHRNLLDGFGLSLSRRWLTASNGERIMVQCIISFCLHQLVLIIDDGLNLLYPTQQRFLIQFLERCEGDRPTFVFSSHSEEMTNALADFVLSAESEGEWLFRSQRGGRPDAI